MTTLNKSKLESNNTKFASEERNTHLREWCNAKPGRGTKLAAHVFAHTRSKANSLSHYKYGRHRITDTLWATILEGIAAVEQIDGVEVPTEMKTTDLFTEKPKEVKSEATVIEKQIKKLEDSTKSNLVRQYNEWVKTDKVRKLRLANVVFAHNFSLPGREIDYTKNVFNNLIRLLMANEITDTNIERVNQTIKKVNILIANNSPFAIAAGRANNK